MVIQLFLNLWFLISWKKSELTPSQNFLFLGEHYRTDLGLIFPPEKTIVSLCQRIVLFQHSVLNSQTVISTARFPQLTRWSGSARASPHSAPTVLSSSTLASSLSRLGSKDPSLSFTVTSPTVVDKQGECDERSISVSTSSYPNSLHRCSQPGLGSLSRGKLGLRVVVPSTTEGAHQPVGDESSSFGLVSFQNNSPSQICGSGNRLYYRSSLSEKPGRHSLFQPVFSLQGDSPSLLGTQIQLVVRHIPGHLNVLADTLSRSLAPVNTEWELLQIMFNASVFFGVVLIWICLLRHWTTSWTLSLLQFQIL